MYTLNPEADYLFPKAYGPLLHSTLDVLAERMTPEEVDSLLRAVGRHVARQWEVPAAIEGEKRARLEEAVAVLNQLGGMAEFEQHDGVCVVQGYSCPFAAFVPDHPEVCHLAETLLTTLIGVSVQEQCQRNETAHCRFVVPIS